jgi:exosortase/archaeosortase family protein
MKIFFTDKKFLRFILLFMSSFLLCYYAAQFITGLAVPGGMYSPFVEKYFNVAGWLRSSLILSTKWLLAIFGIETVRINDYSLRVPNGRGIRIVYACLGFAVMSFWVAYVLATTASIKNKVIWFFAGLFLLWVINVVRISLVLVAANKGWKFPFGINHHTWFNIIAYMAIFAMMYFFEKHIKNKPSIES